MIYYIIPARRNSVGVPFKNRMLLQYTMDEIPEESNVIVHTDDEYIIEKVQGIGADIIERSDELSQGDVSIKKIMVDVIDKCSLQPEDIIVMLYLVYPTRTKNEILQALKFYTENDGKSLLCRYEPYVHPCLSFYAKDGHKGKVIIEHSFHRRQDYPECFNLSHFICIFNVGEIDNLKEDLYNEDTLFYSIEAPIDIDNQKDLDEFRRLKDEQ